MRKFACLLLCLVFLLGLALMDSRAAMAFDFLKSVENAAKSMEKKLDETFDKKNPGSDESLEQKVDKQKVANEAPKPAPRKKPAKGESVVDSVKDQAGDMYKTGKGVFVKEEKKSPGAAKSNKAEKAPRKSTAQAKRIKASATAAKPRKVESGTNPCGKGQKGMFGCLRLTVKDTDGNLLKKYVLDYKSLSGGGGGNYRGHQELFSLSPGKTQFLLKCQGKRKAFVVEAKADQLVEREFVFPAVYKGKIVVNCKMGDNGFGNFGISLYDPATGKQKYSTIDAADGKGSPIEVNTGKYRLVVDYSKTKMKKDLGIIEVKKGQTLTKSAVLERGTASLTVYDSKGEMVGPSIRIKDSKTGKVIHAISGPPEPYVFQLAPGEYKVEVKKGYKGKTKIESITVKNNEVVVKDITLPN